LSIPGIDSTVYLDSHGSSEASHPAVIYEFGDENPSNTTEKWGFQLGYGRQDNQKTGE
jgi:hypothetical protein